MKTKHYILLVFVLLLAILFSLNASATSNRFLDGTGELSYIDASLEATLSELTAKHNIEILIYAYRYEEGTRHLSDEKILEAYGLSTYYADVALLILERYEHSGQWHCFISTYGEAYDRISDSEIDYLLRDGGALEHALNVSMSAGLPDYLIELDRALGGNSIPIHTRLGAPIFLSVLGALIAFLCVFISYKRKVRSDCYPLKEFTNMNLTYSNDQFAGTTVTRTYSPRSNNSSRSGGRGGGGGGRRGGR